MTRFALCFGSLVARFSAFVVAGLVVGGTLFASSSTALAACGGGGGGHYRPAPVVRPVAPPPAPALTPEQAKMLKARKLVDAAKLAFQRTDYDRAIQYLTAVVAILPESADARQFKSLAHFMKGDYQAAAAEAYDALAYGPTWTWDTLQTFFVDSSLYAKQYRSLSAAAKADPNSLSLHFLLAYHHLVLGHYEHGQQELETVLRIQPNEPLSVKLLAVVKQVRQDQAGQLASKSQ